MDQLETFSLNNLQAKASYINGFEAADCMSLTFSLNPLNYGADILSQFRMAITELKSSNIFYVKDKLGTHFHTAFYGLWLVPELTSKINIHFHGYLKCDPQYFEYFRNQIRKLTWNNKVFGRQHTCKVIDNMNDTLRNYPFKDLSILEKFPDSKKMFMLHIKNI